MSTTTMNERKAPPMPSFFSRASISATCGGGPAGAAPGGGPPAIAISLASAVMRFWFFSWTPVANPIVAMKSTSATGTHAWRLRSAEGTGTTFSARGKRPPWRSDAHARERRGPDRPAVADHVPPAGDGARSVHQRERLDPADGPAGHQDVRAVGLPRRPP